MKTNEFRIWLLQFGEILDDPGSDNPSKNLQALLNMFIGHETKTMTAFIKNAKNIPPTPDTSHPTVAPVTSTLKKARIWIDSCAKATYKKDLDLFLEFLKVNESANIQSFVSSVASALKPKLKTKSKSKGRNMNQAQIDQFVARLTANFEDEDSFMAICHELAENKDITQLDAVAVARGIDSRIPARTSKKGALSRVQKRFEELKTYRNKANSMQGRSAA